MKQTVDALWICIFRQTRRGSVGYGRIAYFRVRLCKFARSTKMGIPGPPFVERANSTALTLFLYKPINRQRGEPAALFYAE